MNFTLSKSNMNFKVYTVAEKPTDPGAENDIAIISSVPMTNWIMSTEKPSGIPRNNGDVWIQYSTKGDTFNALKQNAMMIAMIKAWQYLGGAWVDKVAESYQGGAWVDWIRYFYSKGNLFEDITGGWSTNNLTWGGSVSAFKSPTFNSDNILLKRESNAVYAVATENNIDFTGVSKLCMRCTSTDSGSTQHRFGVTRVAEIAYGTSGFDSPASMQIPICDNDILELDVSAVDMGRIYAVNDANSYGATVAIHDIWSE